MIMLCTERLRDDERDLALIIVSKVAVINKITSVLINSFECMYI